MNNTQKGLLGVIVVVCLWFIVKNMFPDYYNSLIGVKKTCEPGFSLNANVCEPIICGPGYIMNAAKTGCDLIECKPYEIRNASKLCELKVCPEGQWLDMQTGTCNPCGAGFRINAAKTGCDAIVCEPGYKLNSAGTGCDLIECKPNEIRNASNLCELKVCPDRNWLDIQGTCNPCETGFKVNASNSGCEPILCATGKILDGSDCVFQQIIMPTIPYNVYGTNNTTYKLSNIDFSGTLYKADISIAHIDQAIWGYCCTIKLSVDANDSSTEIYKYDYADEIYYKNLPRPTTYQTKTSSIALNTTVDTNSSLNLNINVPCNGGSGNVKDLKVTLWIRPN